jgi:hypothetical protein
MIPQPGDVVAVDPRAETGTVVRVTQHVVGDGRYVTVKFNDGSTGTVHESRVRKLEHSPGEPITI